MIWRLCWWIAAAVSVSRLTVAVIDVKPVLVAFYAPLLAVAIMVLTSKETGP